MIPSDFDCGPAAPNRFGQMESLLRVACYISQLLLQDKKPPILSDNFSIIHDLIQRGRKSDIRSARNA
jgi:hypothetical protein